MRWCPTRVCSCVVLRSVAAQLRTLTDLLESICEVPDRLTFIFNGEPTHMITMPTNADTLTGQLVATRRGTAFPLPADTVVQPSDPTIATATLDVATGTVVITRAAPAGGNVTITALGGGLTATLEVNVVAAAADTLAFDEASFQPG